MVAKNYYKEEKFRNRERRVIKFFEGKWYSGRARVWYTIHNRPKEKLLI